MSVGSLQNLMAGQSKQSYAENPQVGDGATIVGYTDRYSATVVRVYTQDKIEIQEDQVTYQFPSGTARAIFPDPKGRILTVVRAKRGRRAGQWRSHGQVVMLGVRDPHYDFQF